MSRYAYNEIDSYSDGRKNPMSYGTTGNTDHVCRPVIIDAEGRRNPIIRYTGAHNAERQYHVVQEVVEHVSHRAPARAPVVRVVMSGYGYGRPYDADPELEEVIEGDGIHHEQQFMDHGSTYEAPVDSFLNKILNEVNQPAKVSPPVSSNWRARPISPPPDRNHGRTKYDDDKDYAKGNYPRKKTYSVPVEEKQREGYHTPAVPANMINYNERRPNDASSTLPNRPLSRPGTDINTALQILTEGVKNMESNPQTRPTATKAGNKVVHWGSDAKANSDADDQWKVKEQNLYGMEKPRNYYQEAVNPITNRPYYEKPEGNRAAISNLYGQGLPATVTPIPQQQRFGMPPSPPKEVNSYSHPTIDSSEAKKRYGKLKPQQTLVPEYEHTGAINSDDLIKKYNGAKVPW